MRAADDFTVIRARMEELQRESRKRERPRDWREYDPADAKLIENAKRIIARGRAMRC